MEKVKEILAATLMLFIFAGVFTILYRLLVWHTFPALLGYSLLIALVMLKSILTRLRNHHPVEELTPADQTNLMLLLLFSLSTFCSMLLIAFLVKEQLISAAVSFLALLCCIHRTYTLFLFKKSKT